MSPRVSFLIPTRDNAPTIAAAVRSALAQTVEDLEVVVVNDGSTDDTPTILDALAREDVRVRPVHCPPIGICAAMNLGLEAARAPIVARLDGDDLARPERLALQLPWLDDAAIAVVDGRVRLFRDDDQPIPEGMRRYVAWVNERLTPEEFDREILVESPIIHPAATYRRDEVRAIGGYRHGPFPEDYDLWLRLHARGRKFRKVPELVLDWRDHGRRLTRTDPRYGQPSFRVLRQQWLAATVLARPRRILLWGAGKEAKPWIRWLPAQGHTIVAAVDVAKRRWGGTRAAGTIPVVGPDAVPSLDAEIGLVAVGARDAREEIRGDLGRLRPDWREGVHWWALR